MIDEPFDINFENVLKSSLDKALKDLGHLNILIAGRTGVGKSTLINAIFQGNLATTGQGRPVTQNTREITKEDIPLSIFDTRGLEMADFPETLDSLSSFVHERTTNNPEEHIHIAWICISEDLRRVESADENLVKKLTDYNISVIAVITKARSDNGFRSKVQQLLPNTRNVIRVLAIGEKLDSGHYIPPMGLDKLVESTMQVVPEGLKRAFTAAQKVDIKLKKSQSHKIVASAAITAAGMGATPIPFSDFFSIVPIQMGMIAAITVTFGLSPDRNLLLPLLGTLATTSGGTITGRAVVSGLLKFTGAGALTGGAIAASTAGAITTAFGEAYIKVLEKVFIHNNGERLTNEDIVEAFKKDF